MSDLQCPATLLVIGRAGWPDTAPSDLRIACVYSHPGREAEATMLAARFDAPLRGLEAVTRDLGEQVLLSAGDLQDIADLHRGETVVLLPGTQTDANTRISLDGDGAVHAAW